MVDVRAHLAAIIQGGQHVGMCHGRLVRLVQALAELLIDVLNSVTAHIDLIQVFYLAAV